MGLLRKKKISFWTVKKVPTEVNVRFRDSYGNPISFKATKRVSVPVKVTFYAKKKRRRW